MKKIIKLIGNIIFIFVLVILVCVIYLNVAYSMNRNSIPSIAGVRMMTVLSGSMRPMLEPGDVIFTKETEDIDNNDVITFKKNRIIITHRIIEVVQENNKVAYRTKGDNNNVEDNALVYKNEILGKYMFKVSKMGYAMEFFRSKMGLIIIGSIVGLLVIFEVIKGVVTSNKNKE